MSDGPPVVALFRPDDARMRQSAALVTEHGGRPLCDPMLSVVATGQLPPLDAPMTVFTSRTGVEIAAAAGWTPAGTDVVAIGPATAAVAVDAGWARPPVPGRYDSEGLAELIIEQDPTRVVIARSDHGSAVLPAALAAAAVPYEEVVLYRLERPGDAGTSVTAAAEGAVDALAFTSSLTVDHFHEIAAEADLTAAIMARRSQLTVGAIGAPTAETLGAHGLEADCIPAEATADALIEAIFQTFDAS